MAIPWISPFRVSSQGGDTQANSTSSWLRKLADNAVSTARMFGMERRWEMSAEAEMAKQFSHREVHAMLHLHM